MENTVLVKWLEELLAFRQAELKEFEEFNSFSAKDNELYTSKNNMLVAAIDELKKSANSSKYEELKNKYAYLAADFENYRKQSVYRETQYYYNAKNTILNDILPVVDDFERIIKELDKKEKQLSETLNPIEAGIRITYENLIKTLNAEGCIKINCSVGDKFDVNKHEAIAVRKIADTEGYDADDICEIYQSGWMVADKVIRPTKVVVCQ